MNDGPCGPPSEPSEIPRIDEREPRVSQYPPPYYQPPYGSNYAYPPRGDDPRRPARRAAILMGVIGGLGLLLAGMMLVSGIVATPEMIAASPQAQQFQKMETQTGMTFRQMANMVAGFLAVPSLVFAAMALFVWRGGRGSVMTGLVFTACVTAFVSLQTLAGMAMGDPGAICFGVVLVGMLGWLCRWLWQARRAIPLVEAMRYAPEAPAPAPAAWPAPPNQAHVPTYAPPVQPPVFGPATLVSRSRTGCRCGYGPPLRRSHAAAGAATRIYAIICRTVRAARRLRLCTTATRGSAGAELSPGRRRTDGKR